MATQLMKPREVPLGGLRAITVRRTLPAKDRSFVGAWCFVDHYGPQRVRANNEGGMDVPPHPHTGLQTVSWLFEGEIEHRDSGGAIGQVRPGELNLMTSGAGICHSEVSTESTDVLHGVQLWVVLPDADRHTVRNFEHFAAEPVALADDAGTARVFLGALADVAESPVHTYTPLLGAQLDLAPDAKVTLRLDPTFEHGVLLDTGAVSVDGEPLEFGDLVCQDEGPDSLVLQAGPDGARIILLGGEPFEEEIIMWWNFVGRTHDEIEQFREQWQAQAERFGEVEGYEGETLRIAAPKLPGVRLRPRNRRGKRTA
ncbi:pirin family protein [Yimella sp. RIT 621]|uniref:pirin family protein n=2 Tax=unclassified Yimella TaxID=2649892 RepID=UPI00101C4C55|nr:pirin family protein [Yimella sp. RIT 621]RYG76363.1 pirin family protein [Yimella sp. RIT 621]